MMTPLGASRKIASYMKTVIPSSWRVCAIETSGDGFMFAVKDEDGLVGEVVIEDVDGVGDVSIEVFVYGGIRDDEHREKVDELKRLVRRITQ